MKENCSLPEGCELNSNVTIYKHTALKLDKPALIISEQNNLGKPAYYISFRDNCMVNSEMMSVGKIVYYDEFGNDFFSEYYYNKDRKHLFQTRFKQIQKRVIQVG